MISQSPLNQFQINKNDNISYPNLPKNKNNISNFNENIPSSNDYQINNNNENFPGQKNNNLNNIDNNPSNSNFNNNNNFQITNDNENFYTPKLRGSYDKPNNMTNQSQNYSPKNLELITNDKNYNDKNNLNDDNNNNEDDNNIYQARQGDCEENLMKANELISILQQENESLKKQRDTALNNIKNTVDYEKFYKDKQISLENKINELNNLNDDYQKKIKDLNVDNDNLRNNLHRLNETLNEKNIEINNLNTEIRNIQKDAAEKIDELNNNIDGLKLLLKQQENNYEDQTRQLNDKIKDLQNILAEEKRKNDELKNKILNLEQRNENIDKLLQYLFDFYNNVKQLLYPKDKKESLKDVIDFESPDDFKKVKLYNLEEKLKQWIEDFKMKFGSCFACDIACCTSETDRLRYFRRYYPGLPNDNYKNIKKRGNSKK